MKSHQYHVLFLLFFVLAACSSSPFVSSWLAPDAVPMQLKGSKVVAVVVSLNESTRRAGEDALAAELTARGALGVPLYQLLPTVDPDDEALIRTGLEQEGVAGAVLMRPVGVKTEVVSSPSTTYSSPRYSGLWGGGYYAHGWRSPWIEAPEIRTNTIMYVETLVYSLKQNKLVWAGESKTTNPSNLDRLVKDVAAKVSKELERLGYIAP